jgi:hypothetical protein
MSMRRTRDVLPAAMLAGFLLWTSPGFAQAVARPGETSSAGSLDDSVRELREQIRELQTAVTEIRSEAQRYRAETTELRKELEAVRSGSGLQERARAGVAPVGAAQEMTAAGAPDQEVPKEKKQERAASLEEEYELLSGKVDEQYQTKVESASKYRVRLSGIVLLNMFSNTGPTDNDDIPSLTYGQIPGVSGGSFGATLRQSQIGLEVFGPEVAGARTRANLQMDFGGGFAQTLNGTNFGLMRLRTGTVRLDWARTSIVAGQDGLFFAPLSPTSFASLAIPSLAYAGNLWSWVPQVRVEHRWSVGEESSLLLQGGILDGESGEPPALAYYRLPQAGESSRQPAYGTRVAWSRSVFGLPLRVGTGGYYSRQNYGLGRTVDAWAAMADWELPLGRHVSLTGKMYRGRGLGGLGGGIGRSVLFSTNPSDNVAKIRALNSAGGWAQLKYRATSRLEFNGAVGQDDAYGADLRAFSSPAAFLDPHLAKNQAGMVNVIYRPRSDLLLSAEYRHLKTSLLDVGVRNADHINLMMGILF